MLHIVYTLPKFQSNCIDLYHILKTTIKYCHYEYKIIDGILF